jgi:hypothetical protein
MIKGVYIVPVRSIEALSGLILLPLVSRLIKQKRIVFTSKSTGASS